MKLPLLLYRVTAGIRLGLELGHGLRLVFGVRVWVRVKI